MNSATSLTDDILEEKLFDRLVLAAISYNTKFKSRIYNGTVCG
jgi:hypothetical protein